MYESVQAYIHQVGQFDESIAVGTTYLGKVEMQREDSLKAQEQFSLADQSTTMATLPDGTDCKILLDSGNIKSFMSKQNYLTINYCMVCLSSVQSERHSSSK